MLTIYTYSILYVDESAQLYTHTHISYRYYKLYIYYKYCILFTVHINPCKIITYNFGPV